MTVMKKSEVLLANALQSVLVLDRTEEQADRDALYAFALDELLCRQTGKGGPAICHIWKHSNAFIMGLRDSRLPKVAAGKRMLEERGWCTAVRHSGGAAVPLDSGVINVSLILPIVAADFKQDFELMYQLVREAVHKQCGLFGEKLAVAADVRKGEIAGAYCPGDYDLSINGYKFCGIAQRRQSHAFIVQAFIVADGSGAARAQLVREFYDLAGESASADQYPLVVPDSMRSLSELLPGGVGGGRAFIDGVKQTVRVYQGEAVASSAGAPFVLPTEDTIEEMIARLRSRYTIDK